MPALRESYEDTLNAAKGADLLIGMHAAYATRLVAEKTGIGTTAMAMRAGRPMLIVPRSWDQPDNGHRAGRLGIARTLSKRQFTPKRAAVELRQLLYEPSYQQRASRVQQQIQAEDGSKAACDVLEKLLMAVSLNNF